MLMMMCLEGDSMLVGESIEITLISSTLSRVRLMVSAPRNIGIVRSDTWKTENPAKSDDTTIGRLVTDLVSDESLFIGDDIEVVVGLSKRGRARLGIQAPVDVPIMRSEVWIENQRIATGTHGVATA